MIFEDDVNETMGLANDAFHEQPSPVWSKKIERDITALKLQILKEPKQQDTS